jgi:hypothetical protein
VLSREIAADAARSEIERLKRERARLFAEAERLLQQASRSASANSHFRSVRITLATTRNFRHFRALAGQRS